MNNAIIIIKYPSLTLDVRSINYDSIQKVVLIKNNRLARELKTDRGRGRITTEAFLIRDNEERDKEIIYNELISPSANLWDDS